MDTSNHILYKFLAVTDRWEDPEVVWIPLIVVGFDLNPSFFQNVCHHFSIVAEGIKLTCSNVSWWILGKTFAKNGKLSRIGNIRADGVLGHE